MSPEAAKPISADGPTSPTPRSTDADSKRRSSSGESGAPKSTKVRPAPRNQNQPKRSKIPAGDASITSRRNLKETKKQVRLIVRQGKGADSGTISSGVKEIDSLCTFTLRVTDNGRRIHLRYRDESGKRHYPYACHLVSAEWRTLTRRGYHSAVNLIAEKTAARKDGNPAKIKMALDRIRLLQAALDE